MEFAEKGRFMLKIMSGEKINDAAREAEKDAHM